MAKIVDQTGRRYTRLVVLGQNGRSKAGAVLYKVRCDCGNEFTAPAGALARGSTKSCGCWREDRKLKHGHARDSGYSPEYGIWKAMIQRCTNPRHKKFSIYGGRGILVCDRWRKFANFIADIGTRPSKAHTLERKNNDAGYSPDNCRWATRAEQNRNRSVTVPVTINGKIYSLAEACRMAQVAEESVRTKMKTMSALEAIVLVRSTTPRPDPWPL